MPSKQKVLYIDYSTCIGCETCEYVCRFVHDTPRIHMMRTAGGVMAPLYCRHCESPNCAKVCKRGAIVRDKDGAMILQPQLCRGCETRQCLLACPYAAMFETDTGVMLSKCDLCAGRRRIGLLPACQEMCPCGAIHFVAREDVAAIETDKSREAFERVMGHLRPGKGQTGDAPR